MHGQPIVCKGEGEDSNSMKNKLTNNIKYRNDERNILQAIQENWIVIHNLSIGTISNKQQN